MNGTVLNNCVRVAHAAILEHREEIAGLDRSEERRVGKECCR